ncbi:MAG TPA: Wzz/FepE/Etk N-terminal domain-containing protein [Stellaceae bacterium]|nr:Wzz/FepE/Etk N-terminal domain-containing protein [Stellaceae bacterium]
MAGNPYDLTSRELLSILFKEKRKLVLVFVVLCVTVVGCSFLLTPYYEATTRLLVKTGPEFQTRSDTNQPIASVPSATKLEVVNSEIQILTSRDLAEGVVNKIGAQRLYPGAASVDAAIRSFQAGFKAGAVEQSDVINASYNNRSRAIAIEALKTIVDLYQQKHAEMFADPRYKFLEQQTQQYQDQLDALIKKETDLRNSKSLFDVDAQRAKLLDDRAATRSIIDQLKSQSIDTHQRIDFLTQRLKVTPALITAGVAPADAVEQAKARLLDLEVKQQQLKERYVGDVKPIQDTNAEIAKLRAFVSRNDPLNTKQWSQRNTAYDDLVVALNRALADAAPLDAQIALREKEADAIDAKLRDLQDGATTIGDLERERRVLEELVHNYRTQYENARLNVDLDRARVVSVSIVQRPDASEKPAGPHHLPFALAGILIGLIGASGVLLYLLVFRETLITVESVERIIGLPVVASVAMRPRDRY